MPTFHIHIGGQVQGVGFRPYVFRLAETFLLRGTVCNASNGVHIELTADEMLAHNFFQKLLENAPILSRITHSHIETVKDKFFDSFEIIHSDEGTKANLLVTPDFALCDDCRKELKNPHNHRFHYPFITCTNCGSRYSIIKKLPYDRRYYSQTNTCSIDGVTLSHPVLEVITAINEGKIIALKGIGGYLLLCDATNPEVLKTLRKRKHRPTKPFALMYPSLEMLENDVVLRGYEKEMLQSPQAPIVLLNIKNEIESGVVLDLIAPKLSQLGVMLPYTPLFELITEGVGKPQYIITDKHPDYFSTQLGERLSKEWNIPLRKVQHHKAHFAAVMAENGLLDAEEPILGVIWDGTGLGDDGNIWGGEFFKYEKGDYLRCYYFDYFPLILGDKMPREPRISALSLAYDVMGSDEFLNKKFSNTEGVLYRKMLIQEDVLQTSSVGRLFDGVTSLLGLADKVSYEGEAAMLLEECAKPFFRKNGLDFSESYVSEGTSYYRIPTKTLIQNIVFDLKKGKEKDLIAAKFHVSLVHIIKKVAQNVGCQKLAFSGGVFQNSLLVDLIIHHLDKKFEKVHEETVKILRLNLNNCSFGRAAKIIAIYIKTAVLLPNKGDNSLSKVAFPPIDNILLSNLKNQRIIDKYDKWTTIEESEKFFKIITEIKKHLNGKPFWEIERFWQPNKNVKE